MKVLRASSMREADRKAIEDYGIPGIVLMETAGTRVTDFILDHFGHDTRVVVLCGPGNNGGDGLVIARQLYRAGIKVSPWGTQKRGTYRGDAAVNENICIRMGLPPRELTGSHDLLLLEEQLNSADLVVDALLGTGANRETSGFTAEVINMVNHSSVPVISVDVPSGVNADTGEILGSAVKADWTLTFAYPKLGLFLYPGAGQAGRIFICDINIPHEIVEEEKVDLLDLPAIRAVLPGRPGDAHKGSFGRVLIVAGSPGMTGAAALAAESALKAGAGLIYLAAPVSICPTLEAKLIEVITIALAEKEPGLIDLQAAAEIIKKAEQCDVLCIGPGLNPAGDSGELMREIIRSSPVPLVIDAGALTAIEDDPGCLKEAKFPPVITPHPGEMARLTGLITARVQSERLGTALEKASEWNCIIILKGANTIIASPNGSAAVNPTGNAVLATAGSGDLLSGMVASFIAQGMTPYQSAMAGVYIHGLAGDLLTPVRGCSALDIKANFKQAFQYIRHSEKVPAHDPYITPVKPVSLAEGDIYKC